MKNSKQKLAMLALAFHFYFATGQCDSDAFMDKCAGNLGGSIFIKSLVIKSGEATESKPELFSYVFSKGSTYNLVVCDQNDNSNKLIISLLDRNKKEIGSNYNKKTKKFYTSISYPCSATGVYYIESHFESSKAGTCGVAILGFTKQ
jgi:hypothetical protein